MSTDVAIHPHLLKTIWIARVDAVHRVNYPFAARLDDKDVYHAPNPPIAKRHHTQIAMSSRFNETRLAMATLIINQSPHMVFRFQLPIGQHSEYEYTKWAIEFCVYMFVFIAGYYYLQLK